MSNDISLFVIVAVAVAVLVPLAAIAFIVWLVGYAILSHDPTDHGNATYFRLGALAVALFLFCVFLLVGLVRASWAFWGWFARLWGT